MKASKFSDEQKAFILKQGADAIPVAEFCRRTGISQASYFNWKKKYDGLLPTEMKRFEDENSKLSKLVAQMCSEWDASIRRACRVLEFDTSTDHYKSRHGDQAGIAARNKDICAKRVRYGYRRVHVMLKREGWDVNMKRIYRIYRDLALQLRNKTPKRRVKAKLREDRAAADVRTMCGRWTSSTINSPRAKRSAS